MSALDGWFEIMRTGEVRDERTGKPVTIDEARLEAIAAESNQADAAPVVLGHNWRDDAPAQAWVSQLRRMGDRLQCRLSRIDPDFRKATEAGRYAGRSVGVIGNRLRHIAFLGAKRPHFKGLAPEQFSEDAPEGLEIFSLQESNFRIASAYRSIVRYMRGMRERLIATNGIEDADASFPEHEIDNVEGAINALENQDEDANPYAFSEGPDDKGETMTSEATSALGRVDKALARLEAAEQKHNEREEKLAAKEQEIDEREVKLTERDQKLESSEKLAAAEVELETFVTSGRVPPKQKEALAGALVELSEDGKKSVMDFLGALPKQIRFGEVVKASEAPEEGDEGPTPEVVAAKARQIRIAAQERGESMTVPASVQMAQKELGVSAAKEGE